MSNHIYKKILIIIILITIVLLGGFFYIINSQKGIDLGQISNNVHFSSDLKTQIIDINSGSGFLPTETIAKADIPTIIKFSGNGRIDCSNTLNLGPSNISNDDLKFIDIPIDGNKEVKIFSQSKGAIVKGSCIGNKSNFNIRFI